MSGAPGIGKTRLLQAVTAAAAASGVRCLRATGHPLERDYGFGVVQQLVAQLPVEVRDDVASSAGTDGGAGDALFATLHALHGALVRAASEKPLLVVVDDAQWVDDPSLRFLHFVARRLEGVAIGIVVAVRSAQQHDSALLAELGEVLREREVPLAPLSRDAVATLLGDRFGDVAPEFVGACMTWTRGNPLYLGELASTMAAEGITADVSGAAALAQLAPGTIGRLVFVRIARAGEHAVALAQAVAVLGDATPVTVAARLAGLDLTAAGTAAARLIGLEILDESLTFVHPVVREAVYDDMAAPVRGARHLAAAEVLHEHGVVPDLIAAQLLLAPDSHSEWADDVLQRAARSALNRGAPEAAARFLAKSLDRGGAGAVSVAALERHEPASEPGAGRNTVDVTRTHLLWIAGRSTAAIELAARTRTADDDGHQPDPMVAMTLILQCVTPGAGRPDPALLDAFSTLEGRTQVERDCLLAVLLRRLNYGTPLAEIRPIMERLVSGGGPGAELRRSPSTWLFPMVHLGDLERSSRNAERYLEDRVAAESPMWRGEALAVRALVHYRLGRLVEAEHDARLALVDAGGPFTLTAPVAASTLMHARLALGDLPGAVAAADDFRFPSDREDTAFEAIAQAAIGRVRVRVGAVEEGLAVLRRAGDTLDAVEWFITDLSPWRVDAAEALVALGRHAEARATLQPAADAAVRFGSPIGLGRVLRVRALCDQPVDVDLLREAVAVYDGHPLPLKRAQALVDLGAALRRSGQRSAARSPLEAALDLAHRSRAQPLVDRASAELVATGARPRTAARTGPESLTPSELRVARLAADGLRNADIARELFIQPTTVEKHLASVFRKLAISSRAELPPLG